MTRAEVLDNFVASLERERISLGLTQSEMAQKLEMSLSRYKKIVAGGTIKIDLYVAYRMHLLTGKWFFEFCGEISEQTEVITLLRQLNSTQLRFIKGIVDFELAIQDRMSQPDVEDYITLLTLTGNQEDGMVWDSFNMEKIDIAPYRKRFGGDLNCALKVNSNHLHPVYQAGDILLVSLSAPRDGDTGIFINKETGRAYLRRFRQTNPYQLEPINSLGTPIFVDGSSLEELGRWTVFGRVLCKMR